MKITFTENKMYINFELSPETPEEVSQLVRFTQNVKAEKPDVYLSFSGAPCCTLTMMKIREGIQRNSISNKK